jgi:hypothetical protein
MPAITIYMNCDTRLAINLKMFNLGDNDEFIFVIKNYDYIESGYEYLFRARKSDIDENGEVIFKISPKTSKRLKPGAFYNFAMFVNAYDRKKPTEYKKLTENGEIHLEYGAQDMLVPNPTFDEDIVSAKLVTHNTPVEEIENPEVGELISGKLVPIEEA